MGAPEALRDAIRPCVVFSPPRVPCRVVVIGLITPKTPEMTTPDLSGKVSFSDPAAALRPLLRELESDLVIVLSHLGRTGDLALDLDYLPPFKFRALQAAFRIPYGQVITYGELAEMAGSPKAACQRNLA